MGTLIGLIIIVVVLAWVYRMEQGINKLNESVKRIEEQLDSKKENK